MTEAIFKKTDYTSAFLILKHDVTRTEVSLEK